MFGLTLKTETVPKADRKPQAKPLKLPVTPPEMADLLEEHKRLTAKLRTREPTEDRLKALLASLDIPTYSMSEVHKYMTIKAKAENPTRNGWVWRVADRDSYNVLANQNYHMNRQTSSGYNDGWLHYNTGMYEHTIPLRALRLMAKIRADKSIGQNVVFAVSDYATVKDALPDPFLLVMLDEKQVHVIDFWDEPGFGFEHMVPQTAA